jgi:flagellar basal body rod protein FlgG
MEIGLIAGSRQMLMLEAWQSSIADNLANASTPGFQKTLFTASGVTGEGDALRSAAMGHNKQLILPQGQVTNAFVDGAIRVTGAPYDFVIEDGGFFGVTTSSGERLFTKDGEFRISSEGILTNKMGHFVDVDGAELTIDLEQGPITVTRDGTVNQDGQNLGRISAFSFGRPSELIRLGGSYFSDPGSAEQAQMENAVVLQGHLMGSSTSAISEMVSMVQVSRAYEMSQKLIQESDERLNQAIQTFSV